MLNNPGRTINYGSNAKLFSEAQNQVYAIGYAIIFNVYGIETLNPKVFSNYYFASVKVAEISN